MKERGEEWKMAENEGDIFVSEAQKKLTRRRAGKACVRCRQRKIKCDIGQPSCSSCLKFGLADQCVYSSIGVTAESVRNELASLRIENEKLRRQLLDGNSSRSHDSGEGPEGEQLDLSKLTCLVEKENKTVFYGLTSYLPTVESHRESYISFLNDSKDTLDKGRKTWKQTRNFPVPLLSIPDPLLDQELFLRHLENFLPDYGTVKEIMSEFFKSFWYQMFPIIDETTFWQDYERIVKTDNGSNIRFSVVNNFLDFSWLSLMLVIIKLTTGFQYKGTFPPNCTIFTDEGDQIPKYIQKLNFSFRRKKCLSTLQTLIIVHCCKKTEVKAGEGGDPANFSTHIGFALDMAISLGLNNDIDIIYVKKPVRFRAALKILWKSILYFDVLNTIENGVVPWLLEEAVFKDRSEENDDLFTRTIFTLRKIISKVNSPTVTFAVVEAETKVLSQFLDQFQPIYKRINEIDVSSSPDVEVIREVILHTQVLSLLSSLYFAMVRTLKPELSRTKNYTMCIKTCLLHIYSAIDLCCAVSKFNKKDINCYFRNQFTVTICGLVRLSIMKSCFYPVSFAGVELVSKIDGDYRPFSDCRLGSPPTSMILRASQWAKLEFDPSFDPYIFRDLHSIISLLLGLYYRYFYHRKLEGDSLLMIEDSWVIFSYWWLHYAKNSFSTNVALQMKVAPVRTNIFLEFDEFPRRELAFNTALESHIESELVNMIEALGQSYPTNNPDNFIVLETKENPFLDLDLLSLFNGDLLQLLDGDLNPGGMGW